MYFETEIKTIAHVYFEKNTERLRKYLVIHVLGTDGNGLHQNEAVKG